MVFCCFVLFYPFSRKAFGSGKYQQSFELLSQAIARSPSVGFLWSMRALTQLRMERWPDALKDAENAILRDKENATAETHCRRGLALYHLNLLDESLAAYDAAAKVNDSCPELSGRKLLVAALTKRNQGTMRRIINSSKAGEEAEKQRDEGVSELKKGDLLKAIHFVFAFVFVLILIVGAGGIYQSHHSCSAPRPVLQSSGPGVSQG